VDKVTKEYGAGGMIWIKFDENQAAKSPIAKFLPEDFFERVKAVIPGLTIKDTLFMIADDYATSWSLLGKSRIRSINTKTTKNFMI